MLCKAIFACVLLLCLTKTLNANDPSAKFETRAATPPRKSEKPDDGYQIIQYKIKRPAVTKKDSPVFYGVGGRVTVDDIFNQYTLFSKQFDDLGSNSTITPTVVYVEQRFFGKSANGVRYTSYKDFADLTVENVVNDHVYLIKKLADELNTKNFMVFGGGHGGLIAGYVANKFATDGALKDYKVLGWSSSPPLKYLKDGNTFAQADLKEINYQLRELLRPYDGCKNPEDIARFKTLFDGIKAADATLTGNLKLTPLPRAAAGQTDLRELVIYIRNKIIGLTFDNNPYDLVTGRTRDTKLKQLCSKIRNVATPLTYTMVNDVLTVIDPRDRIDNWKLVKRQTDDDGAFEKSLAASYYQDCTQLSLVYCSSSNDETVDREDPLAGSQWDTTLSCKTLDEYKLVLQAECRGLFGAEFDVNRAEYRNSMPPKFNNRVITTMNKQSIFDKSFTKLSADKNESNYATNWEIWGVDNWEFQAPQFCDTAKIKDVRYLALRAFGCFTGFVDDKTICNTKTLFNDDVNGVAYDDTAPTSDCPPTSGDDSKFPFGDPHAKVNIIQPGNPPQSIRSTQFVSVPTQPTVLGTTGSGADSLFSVTCVLLSSLLMFTTGILL